MLNKIKQIKISKRTAYISLAVVMLFVGGIGIFTAVSNMQKIVDDVDVIGESSFNPIDFSPEILEKTDDVDSEPIITDTTPVELNFKMPVTGEVKKEFSSFELVFSETMNDYRTHSGIDIVSAEGNPVISSEAGKIISVDDDPLWGRTVQIEHANGMISCYKNLADITPEGIEVGSYVNAGGIIGSIGSTALVEIGEEPHLHFEVILNGIAVNPMEYIK